MNKHCLEPSSPPARGPGAILLETERLIIRRPLSSDAPAFAAAVNFPEVVRNLSDRMPHPYTLEDAENFIQRVLPNAEDDGPKSCYPTTCFILLKGNSPDNSSPEPRLIGSMGCKPGEDVHYIQWTLGYSFTPTAWGKGYATEALRSFIRWAFATWPELNRFQAEVYSFNKASAGLLRKLGFTQEGVRKQGAKKDGKVIDCITFGLLRSDVDMEQK